MGERRQQRRAPNRWDNRRVGAGRSTEQLVWEAIAARRSAPHLYGTLVEALHQRDDADRLIGRLLGAAVVGLWRRGWTPLDAVRVTARQLSPGHADVIAAIAVADGAGRLRAGETMHPRWQAQLAALAERQPTRDGSAVERAVAALDVVTKLPDLARSIPAPGERWAEPAGGARHIDEGLLGRVRGLLAKAESTEFEAEAEALTAKAQELIARHAIDEALLHRPDDIGDAALRRIPVEDPYADAKASLLARVAAANRCEAVYSPAFGWCDVVGFDTDLDAVELLVTSLLAQATVAMTRHGSRVDVSGRSSTRSFRRSFLLGFAQRIGERLREATESQVAEAAAQSSELLPVLAWRDEHVREALEREFPQVRYKRSSVSNGSGWAAGKAAADQANLDVTSGALDR